MQINELQKGDIVLFSPEKNSFLSKAIVMLTNSCVSHAAMVYNSEGEDLTTIIEETTPKVSINNAKERFFERIIYVRRLKSENNFDPVINQADIYYKQDIPYNNPELYMLGLLLIYKKFSLAGPVQKIVLNILENLCSDIIKEIDKLIYDGKPAMICSEFVAQCYKNAGSQYQLEIKNGTLLNVSNTTSLLDSSIQLIKNDPDKDEKKLSFANLRMSSASNNIQSYESLCKELCENLENIQVDSTIIEIDKELLHSIHKFSVLHNILKNRIAHEDSINRIDSLMKLKEDESMFVFPGDLYGNCPDLEDVGTITL